RMETGYHLEKAAKTWRADFVVQACDDARIPGLTDALLQCRLLGHQVYEAVGFSERVLRRLPIWSLRASDLAFADELTISALRSSAKRAFDIAVSTLLLVLALPLMVLVAIALKLDSK